MIKLTIGSKKFSCPQGRHEVTYEQWSKAYEGIQKVEEAKQSYEEGDDIKATQLIVEHVCHIVSSLSVGVSKDDLLKANFEQVNNLFLVYFSWIWDEEPKRKLKIKGKEFDIPDFGKRSGLELMDCMQLLQQMDSDNDAEKGLVIASIYAEEKYKQDFEGLEQKKQWLKDNAKLDLFYSCAFFLRSGTKTLGKSILPPSIEQEVAKLTSTLNDWVCTLYLQVLQKREYSVVQWKKAQYSTKHSNNQSKIYSYLQNIKLQSKKIITKIKNKLLYLKHDSSS